MPLCAEQSGDGPGVAVPRSDWLSGSSPGVCRPVGPVLCITDPERPPVTDVGSAVVPPPAAAASPALGGGGSDKQP